MYRLLKQWSDQNRACVCMHVGMCVHVHVYLSTVVTAKKLGDLESEHQALWFLVRGPEGVEVHDSQVLGELPELSLLASEHTMLSLDSRTLPPAGTFAWVPFSSQPWSFLTYCPCCEALSCSTTSACDAVLCDLTLFLSLISLNTFHDLPLQTFFYYCYFTCCFLHS